MGVKLGMQHPDPTNAHAQVPSPTTPAAREAARAQNANPFQRAAPVPAHSTSAAREAAQAPNPFQRAAPAPNTGPQQTPHPMHSRAAAPRFPTAGPAGAARQAAPNGADSAAQGTGRSSAAQPQAQSNRGRRRDAQRRKMDNIENEGQCQAELAKQARAQEAAAAAEREAAAAAEREAGRIAREVEAAAQRKAARIAREAEAAAERKAARIAREAEAAAERKAARIAREAEAAAEREAGRIAREAEAAAERKAAEAEERKAAEAVKQAEAAAAEERKAAQAAKQAEAAAVEQRKAAQVAKQAKAAAAEERKAAQAAKQAEAAAAGERKAAQAAKQVDAAAVEQRLAAQAAKQAEAAAAEERLAAQAAKQAKAAAAEERKAAEAAKQPAKAAPSAPSPAPAAAPGQPAASEPKSSKARGARAAVDTSHAAAAGADCNGQGSPSNALPSGADQSQAAAGKHSKVKQRPGRKIGHNQRKKAAGRQAAAAAGLSGAVAPRGEAVPLAGAADQPADDLPAGGEPAAAGQATPQPGPGTQQSEALLHSQGASSPLREAESPLAAGGEAAAKLAASAAAEVPTAAAAAQSSGFEAQPGHGTAGSQAAVPLGQSADISGQGRAQIDPPSGAAASAAAEPQEKPSHSMQTRSLEQRSPGARRQCKEGEAFVEGMKALLSGAGPESAEADTLGDAAQQATVKPTAVKQASLASIESELCKQVPALGHGSHETEQLDVQSLVLTQGSCSDAGDASSAPPEEHQKVSDVAPTVEQAPVETLLREQSSSTSGDAECLSVEPKDGDNDALQAEAPASQQLCEGLQPSAAPLLGSQESSSIPGEAECLSVELTEDDNNVLVAEAPAGQQLYEGLQLSAAPLPGSQEGSSTPGKAECLPASAGAAGPVPAEEQPLAERPSDQPAAGWQPSTAPLPPRQDSTTASDEADGLPASAGAAGPVPAEEQPSAERPSDQLAAGWQLSAAPLQPSQGSRSASDEAEGPPACASAAGPVPAEEPALVKADHTLQQPPLDVQPSNMVLLLTQEGDLIAEAEGSPVVMSCGSQEQPAQAATAQGSQGSHEESVSGHCEAGSVLAAHPAQQLAEGQQLDASLQLQSLAADVSAALDASGASAAFSGDQPAGIPLPAAHPAQPLTEGQLPADATQQQIDIADSAEYKGLPTPAGDGQVAGQQAGRGYEAGTSSSVAGQHTQAAAPPSSAGQSWTSAASGQSSRPSHYESADEVTILAASHTDSCRQACA